MELFEQASRMQLRFESPNGSLNVEDLWSLDLTSNKANRANLDDIAKDLHAKLRNATEVVSFVKPVSADANLPAQVAFNVVKHIIDVRVAERDAKVADTERKAKKAKLLEIIGRKQDAALEGQSLEELMAAVNSM